MIGMLWFDNNPKASLDQKLGQAADYYTKKYGPRPTWCMVHPSVLGDVAPAGPIRVIPDRHILPNHFYLGVGDGG